MMEGLNRRVQFNQFLRFDQMEMILASPVVKELSSLMYHFLGNFFVGLGRISRLAPTS